jgi:hypothetical protein
LTHIDAGRYIERRRYIYACRYEAVEKLRLFRKSKERLVELCDRCARVCDAGCRAAAIRERTLMRALRLGVRV